jgi:UDP-N-acetylglucosamine 4,6-dehydratase
MNIKKYFKNKTILITGGTGSIGTELVKYLLKSIYVKKLIIFSRDEQKHYNLKKKITSKKIRYFIGDIRDIGRLNIAFRDVDFVIHAAAQKHVELAEYNPQECIKTNIYGTENVINSCILNKVRKCLLISTDKAVNPINLYGATKLASEKLIINANNLSGKNGTIFTTVRYGNVLGSRGSAIPFFIELTKQNKKIPLTNENMTRFWISYDEAVKFILSSLMLSKPNEIYVPTLNAIRIKDLIKIINPKATIFISGLRKGEKIHEELISKDELRHTIKKNNYFVINYNKTYDKEILTGEYNSKNHLSKKIKKEYIKIIKNFVN